MRQYWESNHGNVLNEKKIKFTFETEPQTQASMYNYNFAETGNVMRNSDFLYFDWITVKNLSSIADLENACYMDVAAGNNDSLDFFEKWTELKYLKINNLSKDEEAYLRKILPKCEIITE